MAVTARHDALVVLEGKRGVPDLVDMGMGDIDVCGVLLEDGADDGELAGHQPLGILEPHEL